MTGDHRIPEALADLIRREATIAAPRFTVIADRVRSACGDGVEAVLLYGSCLRGNDETAGVVDLFVLVGDYGRAPGGFLQRAFNFLLPPNVYFLELARGTDTLRCKYAVISTADFEAGARCWLQPYVWARFAQPSRLLYCRDEAARDDACRGLVSAASSFLENTLPAMAGETLSTREIWSRGFRLSYGAELRPERAGRTEALIAAGEDWFADVTSAAAVALPELITPAGAGTWRITAAEPARRRCLRRWRLRRLQGPFLSVLRWIKAAFTFSGGVDYAVWKIERHTGVRIEVTERLRRHPLLYGWPVLWRLWRSGALR